MPLHQKRKSKTKFQETSVQHMQDAIFRDMSADKKLEIAGKLWLLAKELDPYKVDFRIHGGNRSTASSD